MFKKTIFQLHWFFGISAGLVLALMGLTGAIYEFQEEILGLINPHMQLERRDAQVLPLGELAAKAQALEGKTVSGVSLTLGSGDPARVFFTPPPGERRGAMRFLDPYTGEAMGEPLGMGFFGFVLQLHRFLAIGEVGKQITAASTLALVFFCLSGIYLRWPRKALNWRAWLTLDWAKKGRAFNWDLHAVAGTWCLLFYLCAALTGLTWSYDWFRDGANRLLGDAPAGQQGKRGEGRGRPGGQPPGGAPAPVVDYDALWNAIRQTAGDRLASVNLRLPPSAGQPATAFYLLDDSPHPRALNQIQLDTASGKPISHERYADKDLGGRLLTSIYALHTGEYFGLPGRILMMLASLSMPLFFITGWLLYLDRRRKKREIRAARAGVGGAAGAQGWLIGFASQSGFAEQLAWRAAGQLQAAGVPVQVRPLMRIDEQALRQTRNALFVVATFGDGEAPDAARGFERKMLGQRLDLGGLHYAVLALGDRQYRQFCGFARRVDAWLSGAGARALFDAVEVDDGDSAAIARWQLRLNEITGSAGPLNLAEEPFAAWSVQRRLCLNPGSQGAPTFLVGLQPPSGADWCAGDILEVLPRHPPEKVRRWLDDHGLRADAPVTLDGLGMPLLDALCTRQLPDSFVHLVGLHAQALLDALVPLGVREYSIASLPADGVLELIVRQEFHPDGSLGLGSGWLSEHAPLHAGVRARVRRNSAFHVPEDDRPLILIGNGSGLAGLRSLLKARIAAGHKRNWLLFGERNRAHDFYCGEELQAWQANGELARLDLAFSRDQAPKRYVQDVLGENREELRGWLERGASIYVCGSLLGMAGGVDALLLEVLGEQGLADLTEAGRYRRDVY